MDHRKYPHGLKDDAAHKDWVKGSLMLTGSCFCWSYFVILQAITLKAYPAELSLTAMICLAGAAEGTIAALAMERGNTAIWSIGWNVKLFAAVYAGIFCPGISYYLQGVIMKKQGPIFTTAFNPLSMIIVAVLSSLILKEEISLGRVLGAIAIVIGLHLVVWGKSKDHMKLSPPIEKQKISPQFPMPASNTGKMGPEEFVIVDVSAAEMPDKDPI